MLQFPYTSVYFCGNPNCIIFLKLSILTDKNEINNYDIFYFMNRETTAGKYFNVYLIIRTTCLYLL